MYSAMKGINPDDIPSSVCVVQDGDVYLASEAIETICQHLTCGNHSIVEISPTLRGYARSIISKRRKLLNIEL
jgi:hypothetical protein